MKKILAIVGLLLVVGLLIYYFVAGMTYSEGNRAGQLIKISKKGVVFKTYEGELNLGDMEMMASGNKWEFSVMDDAVYEDLQQYEGQKVSLAYRQVFHSFFWQGDTEYFVVGVEPLDRRE